MQDFVDQLLRSSGGVETAHPPELVAARLFVAVLAGLLLAFAYKRTHTGVVFLSSIPHTQVLLALGGALIWLVVGDNLVRAFGLGGMIGLIRYRTRISDPKDTTVLLFSMIIGMACGLGQYAVAFVGALSVSGTLFWLKWTHRESDDHVLPEGDLRDLLDPGPSEEGKKP